MALTTAKKQVICRISSGEKSTDQDNQVDDTCNDVDPSVHLSHHYQGQENHNNGNNHQYCAAEQHSLGHLDPGDFSRDQFFKVSRRIKPQDVGISVAKHECDPQGRELDLDIDLDFLENFQAVCVCIHLYLLK